MSRAMELKNIAQPLLPAGSEAADSEDKAGAASTEMEEGRIQEPAPPKRVKFVRICAGGAIDRVEFEYSDGTKWSMGGPGGSRRIPPLVLADDEYLTEVMHEPLRQWWFVGTAIQFRTNKGRFFSIHSHWSSGLEEDLHKFSARPGNCIMSLRLGDGVLQGIVEGPSHVPADTPLEMFMVYWLEQRGAASDGGAGGSEPRAVKCPKGHLMREDWSRAGHLCDECSRRGTMARCGGGCDYDLCEVCYQHHAEGWSSAVQRKGFEHREAALRFAERHGAGPPAQLAFGPLRIELEDHPWLDVCRDMRDGCRSTLQAIRSLVRQARQGSGQAAAGRERRAGAGAAGQGGAARSFGNFGRHFRGPLLEGAAASSEAPESEVQQYAGLVVDVEHSSRVRAWGPQALLAMCEKTAADAGEFSPGLWQSRSSSVKGYLDWFRRVVPLALRVLSLLNWREELAGSLCVAACVLLRSLCDGWQPVLTGAVFNLINYGDEKQKKIEHESPYLHALCSWTFGCEGRLPLARSVIFGLMLAAAVQGVSNAAANGVKMGMRQRQQVKLRTAMFEHLLAQDQSLYDILRNKELQSKAELRVMDEITEWLWAMAADIVKLASQFFFLFAISPVMTLTYMLLLPVFARTTRAYLESGLRAQERKENGLSHVYSHVVAEAVYMIRTVKTFSREDKHVALVAYAVGGAAAADAASDSAAAKKARLRHVHRGAVTVFNDVSARAVYCFCLWCGLVWMERDFSAGDMTAYLLLIQQIGGLATRVRSRFWELQRRHDALQAHFEFMDRTPQVTPGEHSAEVQGRIEFRDVNFHYPARPDVSVLKGVGFVMECGQMTALVGASGSGKSTVASLLFRHYDPTSGEILVDDHRLQAWDTGSLHSQMALVAQHPLLFDTSIRNNLKYGCRREVSDEELEEAARMANAHDFVLDFPAGYDTYVGDQGAHMSGGQKQRLSIARAVILRPRILCLDEATSALDAESEGIVQDALEQVMQGRTTLVIAHRLSTIKNASQIVCMRDGRIVEIGTPKELLAKQGYYWRLVKRQVCTLEDLEGFNLELDQKPTPAIVNGSGGGSGEASPAAEEAAGAAGAAATAPAEGAPQAEAAEEPPAEAAAETNNSEPGGGSSTAPASGGAAAA